MKKCMVVLTSGVTIEFKEGDGVSIGNIQDDEMASVNLHEIPLFLNLGTENQVVVINHLTHDNDKEVNVEYYLPSDKVSWCYVQNIKEVESSEKN